MSNPTTPNADLAYRVLDHIDEHPEQWDQGRWIGKAECGTVACFAGWACLLSGEVAWFYGATDRTDILNGGRHVADRAEELLRFDQRAATLVDGDGNQRHLFQATNTRDDIGRIVELAFGPRPTASEGAN